MLGYIVVENFGELKSSMRELGIWIFYFFLVGLRVFIFIIFLN